MTRAEIAYAQGLAYVWAYNDYCCPAQGPHVDSSAFANHWVSEVGRGSHASIQGAFAAWLVGWLNMRALVSDGAVGGVR